MPLNPFSQQAKPSVRVRQLWHSFEQWLTPRQAAMDQQWKQALTDAENEWKKQPVLSRKSSKEFKESQLAKRREIEKKHYFAAREEWHKRLTTAGYRDDDWGTLTLAETKAIEAALGVFNDEDEEIPENVVSVPQPTATAPPLPPPQMTAPSLSTSSLASSISSYELVNPMEFGSDDDFEDDPAEGFFFNVVVSQDLTSEEEDLPVPVPTARGRQWDADQSRYPSWSSESQPSSHHNSQNGSPTRPPPKPFPSEYSRPTSHRSSTASSSKVPSAFKNKITTSSSASTSASAAAAAASTKPRVARQSYIGPVLSDAEDSSEEELEVEFEKFKMQTRVTKIIEFHQAAAELDIALAVEIYRSRKMMNSGKDEDARLVEQHEKKMIQLQQEKEQERKRIVKDERSRRRQQLRHSSLRQPSRSANSVNSSWINEYNNFQPEINVTTPFDNDHDTGGDDDMEYGGPFGTHHPSTFSAHPQLNTPDSLWELAAANSAMQKQKGKAVEPLVDHQNVMLPWGPQRSSFAQEEQEDDGDFEVPEELRRAMNGFNNFPGEPSVESPVDVATPKLGSNPWSIMSKTPTKSSPLASRSHGKTLSQSTPSAPSTGHWGKQAQSTIGSSIWDKTTNIFDTQVDKDPSWLQDDPSMSPSFDYDSNSPLADTSASTPAKGKKAVTTSNSNKAEQASSSPSVPSAPALSALATKTVTQTKVEKVAPPPPPPTAAKKQSKKQRAAAKKSGNVSKAELDPEPDPEPVVEEEVAKQEDEPEPELVNSRQAEPTWPTSSTSLWSEVSTTPRPSAVKANQGFFGGKTEGTTRSSLLRKQIHQATDTETSGASSSRTVPEPVTGPSPMNNVHHPSAIDYTPIPDAIRQSIWGRPSATAERATPSPVAPKPPQQTVRPPESEFWLPAGSMGSKVNGVNGNGVASVSNQFWKPSVEIQSKSDQVNRWSAATNPSSLRRNPDPVSRSPPGFEDIPNVNNKVGPQSILKKTKASKKKGGKHVTIEEVSDEEGDGVLDGTLPLNSRSIMEPNGTTILEPQPSVPRAVFTNLFEYGGDIDDDDEMTSSSSLVPTPSTAPTSPPDDIPPISEEWLAATTKQLNQGNTNSFNGNGWDATVKAKRMRWNSVSGAQPPGLQALGGTPGYLSGVGPSDEDKASPSMSIPGSFPRPRVNSTGQNMPSIWETQVAKAAAPANGNGNANKKAKGKQLGPAGGGEADEGSEVLARFAKTQRGENMRRSKLAAGGKLF